MTTMNLISTTSDGQQVFLTSGQPLISTDGGIIFTDGSSGGKTIVLQDGSELSSGSAGVEYTLIEDTSGGGGGYLQITNSGQGSSGNLVLSQEDLYEVLNDVGSNFQGHQVALEGKIEDLTTARRLSKRSAPQPVPQPKIEKPIGKGPFTCEICPSDAIKPFLTWGKYQKHLREHENDKKFKCNECLVTYNVEKNLRLHVASHNVEDLVCPECNRAFSRVASFKSHLTIHEEEDNLACPHCEQLFTTETKLNFHIEQEHSPEINENETVFYPSTTDFFQMPTLDSIKEEPHNEEDERPQFKVICKLCKAGMKSAKQLAVHMEHHAKLKTLLKLKQKKSKVPEYKGKYFKHKCKDCDKKFQKPSQLIRHERIHTGQKPFVCELCEKAFNQKNTLELHRRKHTGEKPYVCEFCKMGFTQGGNLRSHIKRVHSLEGDEPLIQCDECPCTFKKIGSLNAHISKVHTKLNAQPEVLPRKEDLLFKALNFSGVPDTIPKQDESGKSVLGTVVLSDKLKGKKHLVKVAFDPLSENKSSKVFLCNYCTREFKKPSDICRHLRVHTLEKPYKCRLCSRSFAVKATFQSHMKIHSTGGREHLCKICLKRFDTLLAYKQHAKAHEIKDKAEKVELGEPYMMTNMGVVQIIPRNRAVYNPTSKELMERSYRCSSCTARFKKSSHLKQHQLRHSGEKPFRCEICEKFFVTRGSLNGHIRTHTKDQAFQCSFCPMTFTTKGSARRHIGSSHKKDKPFICPYCQKTFKTNVLCKKHMKVHRKEVAASSKQTSSNLSTIEAKDMVQKQMISEPATLFTADSSGTVTLPTFSTSVLNQNEILANIASDGTITLQQGDMEMTGLQFNNEGTSSSTSFSMANFKCRVCQEVATEGHVCDKKHLAVVHEDSFYCSYKKCGLGFRTLQSLTEHMKTFHPPPLSAIIKDTTATSKLAKVSTKDSKQPLGGVKAASIPNATTNASVSEKILNQSLLERDKISSMKTQSDAERNFPNKCEVCPMSFKKPSDLVRHVRTHTGEKPYKCDQCDKSFSVHSTLNTHKKIHKRTSKLEAPDALRCHICNGIFLSKTALKTHLRIHTGIKPYECPFCGECFRTSGNRKSHINVAHNPHSLEQPAQDLPSTQMISGDASMPVQLASVEPQQVAAPSKPAPFPLTIPAALLSQALEAVSLAPGDSADQIKSVKLQLQGPGLDPTTASLLVDEHLLASLSKGENINILISPETILPDQGNEAIATLAQDSEMFASSSGPSPLDVGKKVCQFCNKSFTKPSMLQRHMRIHTGERPFKCDVCARSFNQKNALQIHMKKHSGERPYVCPFCTFSFTQKGNLKTHIQRSHADQAKMLLANQKVVVAMPPPQLPFL